MSLHPILGTLLLFGTVQPTQRAGPLPEEHAAHMSAPDVTAPVTGPITPRLLGGSPGVP